MNSSNTTPTRQALVDEMLAHLTGPVTWSGLEAPARRLALALPGLAPAPGTAPAGPRARLAALRPPPTMDAKTAAETRAGFMMMLLMLDMASLSAASVLAGILDQAPQIPDVRRVFSLVGGFLDRTGLGRDLSPADLTLLRSRLSRLPKRRPDLMLAALALLGLSETSPARQRDAVFQDVAAPLLLRAAEAQEVDTLLAMEDYAYSNLVKPIETPEHHTRVFAAFDRAYARLSPGPATAVSPESDPPKVGFVVPNGYMMAHNEVLLAFLAGHAGLPAPIISPFVCMYTDPDGRELAEQLDRLGVPWEALSLDGESPDQAHYAKVRECLQANEVEAAVFVSVPRHLGYFARRPLAPAQMWWSLKFALPNFAGLDGYVFYRSIVDGSVTIEGRSWRGGPLAFQPPAPPSPAQVAAIRARYPGKTILGVVAREEKIANPDYLRTVVDVLSRHPDTCFLWTGRTEAPAVREAFEAGGVADRCHFVGWVDPAPYMAAFDVFLDTFPLTGLMAGWAMSLGCPVVSVGALGFIGVYLEPVLSGAVTLGEAERARIDEIFAPVRERLPGLWAKDASEVGPFVDALLADPALAGALGEAQRRYVGAFLSDKAGSAAVQARHFADIARETRTRRAEKARPAPGGQPRRRR